MPEIAEVEVLRKQLCHVLVGSTIVSGCSRHPKFERRTASGAVLSPIPVGRVESITRHGKWLIFVISDARARRTVRVNLGMSGRFALMPVGGKLPEHVKRRHVRWYVKFVVGDSARLLVYVDARCMGHLRSESWSVVRLATLASSASNGIREFGLGPDCLSPVVCKSPRWRRVMFMRSVLSSNLGIKRLLGDQGRLAGLGNIYANEACFHMRVHPQTVASTLSKRHIDRFLDRVPKMLTDSVRSGGTSFGDANTYRDLYGAEGRNSRNLFVYGRAGQSCHICGTTIERIKGDGQSIFFCPKCQGRKP